MPPIKTTPKAEETGLRILDAALELFRQEGFDTATMRDIAQLLPLTHVTESIRNPWLGLGSGAGDLAVVALVLLVSVLGWRRAIRL